MSTRIRRWGSVAGAALTCLAIESQAVTQDNFLARNTQDIVELCTVSATDPLYVAATHFCQGYLVGAYHYQEAFYSEPGLTPLVCPPNPKPSRNEAIAQFIRWAQSHPQYLKERTVDSMMKFLIETWPCKD
ncbi:MAG TPA: Rap1a/Tai family immunity protein [Methylococcaceae bacterium]|nr:Rap1a/Tai family immunity protein [Methylococcaceae bacterium]